LVCGYFAFKTIRKNTVSPVREKHMWYYDFFSLICGTNLKKLIMGTEHNGNGHDNGNSYGHGKKKNQSVSPSTMSTDTIQELVNNYHENQLAFINENLGIDDAHSIWFDLDTVKKFIAEIEHQARLIDPSCPDVDLGIRFYYAAYPENPSEPVPQDYAKRHTLVMIPTKRENDGRGVMLNYDFNPFESDSEKDTETALALTAGLGRSALAQNHGILVPPGSSVVESY